MQRELPDSVDLAILGGGINGAAVAVLAAGAGYRTVLMEKRDFGSGASSKSSKLIHGGIRYLEQAQFALVRESQAEREALLRFKPHLVRPLPFLLPSYVGDLRPAWKLRAGLALYDLLATSSSLPRPTWLTATETRSIAPDLRETKLAGAGLYYDAQVDDARLVLEEILLAEELGTTCLNYCEVTGCTQKGESCEVEYRDHVTQTEGNIRAKCLFIAAGPWTDKLNREFFGNTKRVLRPTRGTHIVLKQSLSSHAVLGASPADGRVFFVIPWRGMSLIGTTDEDDDRDPDSCEPRPSEIDYLLKSAQHYFPTARLEPHAIVSAFAGLRPLLSDGSGTASSVSREARILREGRVFFVAGGKLTTYRAMGRESLGALVGLLGEPTRGLSLRSPWAVQQQSTRDRSVNHQRELVALGVRPSRARALQAKCGNRTSYLLELLRSEHDLAQPLQAERPELRVEVAHAVLHEHAKTLEDLMLRRLDLGHSSARISSAYAVAREMARWTGWSETARQSQLQAYCEALRP